MGFDCEAHFPNILSQYLTSPCFLAFLASSKLLKNPSIIVLPFTFICKLFSIPMVYGYGLSLVAADFGLFVILRKLVHAKDWVLITIYWLSPISLIASYWLGYNDIIPVFLLMFAIFLLKNHRLFLSGILLVAAISAKASMVLSLPIFLIYLFNNRKFHEELH